MDITSLWKQSCEYLKKVLGDDIYSRWIEIIRPVSTDGKEVVLCVDNDFHKVWLEDNYRDLILNAIRAAGAETVEKIVFKEQPHEPSAADAAPLPAIPAPSPEPRPKKGRRAKVSAVAEVQALLNPNFVFERFVVGPSNNFAHSAAVAVAKAPGRAYNPLFIYGSTGLGKTHLMQAIGHRALENPNLKVLYVSSETLLNEYLNSLQTHDTVAFRNRYRNIDVLLVDDIHFLAGKTALQEEFFHTFNALFDARKQIVMTSDRPASEIAGLEQRLVSRFEWGLVTEMERPSLETRLAILQDKQKDSPAKLSNELLTFIAEHISSNIRALEGALTRAISYSALNPQPLTVDHLRHILRDLLEKEHQEDVGFEDIQKAVAEYFDVRLADMSSRHRQRNVAVPRQVAMYLCRRLTKSSLPEIATAFGKTHATIIHACNVIHNRLSLDDDLKQAVRVIARKLGQDPANLQL